VLHQHGRAPAIGQRAGFIGQTPVPFIFAPATGSTFGPYSPTTCDGTQYQVRKQQDFSTEWRLIGDAGAINWQLGAYYLHIKRTVGVSLGADTGNGVIKQLYNAPNTTNPTTLLLADRFKTNVYAGFGSVEWKPNEKVRRRPRAALRYRGSQVLLARAHGHRSLHRRPDQPRPGLWPAHRQARPLRTVRAQGHAQLQAHARIQSLCQLGHRLQIGRFNNQGSAQIIKDNFVNAFGANVTVNDQYRKEWSSAWEAGLKGNLLNGALTFDLAGYYTRCTTCSSSNSSSAASACCAWCPTSTGWTSRAGSQRHAVRSRA
jgi:iron complex outermembrane receptor protein